MRSCCIRKFRLLKRDGNYTNMQIETLLPIVREQVKHDGIAYTDYYKSYN